MNIRNCTISPSALEDLLLHPYCGLWKVPDVEVALRQGPLFFSGREASDRPLIVPHAFSAIGDNDLVGPKMPGIAADSWQKKTAGLKFCPQNRTRFHPQPSADNPFLSSSYVWNSERLKGVQRFSLPSRPARGGRHFCNLPSLAPQNDTLSPTFKTPVAPFSMRRIRH